MAEIVNIYICFQNIPLNCFLIQICLKRNKKKLTKIPNFFQTFYLTIIAETSFAKDSSGLVRGIPGVALSIIASGQ